LGSRRLAQDPTEPARDAGIAGRKDIEAAEPAKKDERRAPRADSWKLREEADGIETFHFRKLGLVELARLDRARGVSDRFRLLEAQTAFAERLDGSFGDRSLRRERAVAPAIVLDRRAVALDDATEDGDAGIEAYLLERDDARERLEEPGETGRSHAAKSGRELAQLGFGAEELRERLRVDIEPEHRAQGLVEPRARPDREIALKQANPHVGIIDRAEILDASENEALARRERSQVAPILPTVDGASTAALENPHGRLEMEGRARRETFTTVGAVITRIRDARAVDLRERSDAMRARA